MDGPPYRSHIRGGKGARKVHMEMLSLHIYIYTSMICWMYISNPLLCPFHLSLSLSFLSPHIAQVSLLRSFLSFLHQAFVYISLVDISTAHTFAFFIFCQSKRQSLHQDAVSHTRSYHRGQPREPRCRHRLPRHNIAATGRDRLHTRRGGGHIHHHRN